MNEKSIKSMNLTERADDCKGNDIHYRNSNNIIVKTRRYPSNENLFVRCKSTFNLKQSTQQEKEAKDGQ